MKKSKSGIRKLRKISVLTFSWDIVPSFTVVTLAGTMQSTWGRLSGITTSETESAAGRQHGRTDLQSEMAQTDTACRHLLDDLDLGAGAADAG